MKESIKYIIRGFYFGIGLSFILFLTYQAMSVYENNKRKEVNEEIKEFIKGQEKNMVINLISSKYSNGGMSTLLNIKNNNNETVYGYTVETEFYNETNKFIGECSSFEVKSINENESENIEVYCKERWNGWYQKTASTRAKFKNTSSSYTVTIKPN